MPTTWYAAKYPFLKDLAPHQAVEVLLERVDELRYYINMAQQMPEPNRKGIETMVQKLKNYVKDARDIRERFNVPMGFGSSYDA